MTPEEETFARLREPPPYIDIYGNKFWQNKNGQLHRDNDLPAIVFTVGEQQWYKNGELHRKNAPAVIYLNGDEEYWENGIRIK